MGKTSQFSEFLASAAAFLLVTCVLFVAPNNASAIQVTKSVDSTMTITMQESSGDDPSDDDSADDDATDDSATNDGKGSTDKIKKPVAASEKGGGLAVTGDALLLAMLGLVALAGAAAYCCLQNKNLSVVEGAHVRDSQASCSQRAGHARGRKSLARLNREEAQKKMIAVTIAAALLAATCFGGFASKTNALAEGVDASVKCTSAVTIDESGNVTSANVTVLNNSLKAIDVESIVAPAELEGWTATFTTTSVAVSGSVTGTWSGTTVPSDILAKVKSNGSATLTFETTIEYDEEEATVTFDANAPSGTTAKVDGANATKTSTVVAGTVLTADLIPADATVTCSDATWQFAGWAENQALLPSDASKNEDLAAKAVALTGQKTFYAIWKDTATSEFWLSSTNTTGTQVSDFMSDTNYRTGREVLNDVDILNAGSTNASYSTVLSRWNSYYDNDVKLYATYDGGASETDYEGNTSTLNGLVEFRILEVSGEAGHLNTSGDANSSDGSVVTFMATHLLPTAEVMNSEHTNAGGWNATALRAKLQSGGEIYNKFPTALTSAIKKVEKLNGVGGSSDQYAAGTTTSDAFWLISYSELYSTGDYNSYAPKKEGTAYKWCQKNQVNGSAANSVLVCKTRSGAASGASSYDYCCWWERSPFVHLSGLFMNASVAGEPNRCTSAGICVGVVPCFSFGPASVTFDANAPSGTTATLDGTSASTTQKVDFGTTLTSDMIPADATVTCSDSSYIFMGWAESKDASACDALKRTDLAAKNVTLSSDKKYYAVWLKSDFWLSSAHADYTEQSQFTSDTYYRTSVDIISDIKILRAGSSNASYDDTLRRWNGYYTNDVRLYAEWSGADATNNLDKLVEFRILQVGEHDCDGSVVTFMATHSLPTAKRMGTRWYNDGGWGSSSLRGEMTSYVQAGLPSGLANAAKEVSKVATSGSYGYWVEGSTTPSKFWLPSYSEIFGETSTWITSSGYYKAEGTQYAWCKANVTNATSTNTSLQNDYKTRAGDAPAGADGSRWWLRSPCVSSCEYFGDVDNDGCPNHDYANKSRGVVPCFAF